MLVSERAYSSQKRSFWAFLAVFEVEIEIFYELQTVFINLYHNHLFWHENTYIFAPYWLFWLEMPVFGPESPHCSQKGPTIIKTSLS